MKIHFDNINLNSSSGPNTFANRLARCLFESGHEVLFEGPRADVSLVFIEATGQTLAKKVIQRLDGIWFKPDEFRTKNKRIELLYNKADTVIFQSHFDKEFIQHHWLGDEDYQRTTYVIGNGIDVKPVKALTIPKLIEMRAAYDKIFVCSANWHPQKRLKANFELFEHVKKTQHSNSCLIILGNNPDVRIANPHVYYAGSVGPEVYNEIYAAADWMFHLSWADHCPNVVIEALAQGTPIVCSETGGTKELIGYGAYGVVLKEQLQYNNELFDYDHPPDIDVTQCTFLPTRQELDITGIPNIDIKHVASEYVKVFERLIVK